MTTGIVLAGGEGTRLRPLTLSFNKHALRIGDKLMVQYPVETLINLGCDNIIVVSTPLGLRDFTKVLPSVYPQVSFAFVVQETAAGIADALGKVRNYVHDDGFYVILGDNIFMDRPNHSKAQEARIWVTRSDEGYRFGCVTINDNGEVTIVEKPEGVTSALIQTGLFYYPKDCFMKIEQLTPSARNELEITDLNNLYVKEKRITCAHYHGQWIDAGTFESMAQAETMVNNK